MPAVNDITNESGQFATSFGLHLVQGFPLLHEVVAATGEQKQVTLVQGLGDGHGAGWDGAQEVTYKAHRLDPSTYHFHPGFFSKGTDDPQQGVDSYFPAGITYNGTANVGVRLPDGLATDDTPSELIGIYRCLRLPDYNTSGQQIDQQGNVVVLSAGQTEEDYYFYSANPARVAAFLILICRGLPKTKVDWPAWCAWRDYCKTLIPWTDGRSTTVAPLSWQTGNGMTVGTGGSAYKSRTTTGASAWDSGTVTETALPVNANTRGLEFTLNGASGGYMIGVTTQTDLPGSGFTFNGLDCALYFEIGGALKVYQLGTLKGTLAGGWTGGQTYRVVDNAGTWQFHRDGSLISHSLGLSAPPAGALYGGIACNPPNSGITAASFNPASGSATGARLIPRFESHIAFTGETELLAALDQVCFQACSDYQIKGRKIRFLTPDPCAPKGTVPAHAAQRQIVHHFDGTSLTLDNIVRRTIQAYPMDVRERWNYLKGIYRDLDDKDLIEDFVEDERKQLRIEAKRKIAPGQPVNMGNMNRSQALRVLKWWLRLRSDRVWFCELRAMADSLHVLPGDIVEVSHTTYNWDHKLFMVLDANDEAGGASERSFVLQEYEPLDYYSDTDHDQHQRNQAPPPPDPYAAPPVVANVTFQELHPVAQDGSVSNVLRGTVFFTGWVGEQLGTVFYKKSTDAGWTQLPDRVRPNPTNGQDVFDIPHVEAAVTYQVVVQTRSVLSAQLPFSAHPVWATTTIGYTTAPLPPTALPSTFDGTRIIHKWTAPADPTVAYYRITDGTGTVINPHIDVTEWTEYPSAATVTRRVYSVNRAGIVSTSYAALTFTMPTPLLPTGYNLAYAGATAKLRHKWTAVEGITYELSSDQSAILWRGAGGAFDENVTLTLGTTTRYLRAVQYGIASAWTSATITLVPPDDPTSPSATYDGAINLITYAWAHSDPTVTFELDNGAGTVLFTDIRLLNVTEIPTYGTASYTRRVRAVSTAGFTSAWVSINATISPPTLPTAGTHTWDEFNIAWRFTAAGTMPTELFEVDDNAGNFLWRGRDPFVEQPAYGTASYTRRVRALNYAGIASAWRTLTFTIPTPPAPAAPTMTLIEFAIHHALPSLAQRTIEIWDSTNPTTGNKLYSGSATRFIETGFATASRTVQRYARVLNGVGIASTFTAYSQTFSAPAAPTLTKDAVRQLPSSIVVHATTTTAKPQLLFTVMETSPDGVAWPGSTADGTDNVRRLAGVPTDLDFDGAAGGTLYLRVAHEDVFGAGAWSTVLAHTFTRFLDSMIDSNSTLARAALQGTPMMSGGGTITWNAGNTLTWTSPLLIAPLDLTFQPNGQVAIAATTTGTINSGYCLVARQTKGSTSAPSLHILDMTTYTRPTPTDTFFDFWLGFRRSTDGKFVLFNGVVLSAGQQVAGDTFIPYLSVIDAMIANATITSAKIHDLSADKITAALLDARIIFADSIGSRNFVPALSQTPAAEPVAFTNLYNMTLRADGILQATAGVYFLNSANSERSMHKGPAYFDFIVPYVDPGVWGYPAYRMGLSYGDRNAPGLFTVAPLDFAWVGSPGGNQIYVEESGTAASGTIGYTPGTRLRIDIDAGGVVRYKYDATGGTTFTTLYTSTKPAIFPLRVDANTYEGYSAYCPGPNASPTLFGVLAPTFGNKLRWCNVVGLDFTTDGADDLSKSAPTGWGNGGCASVDLLPAQLDGAVEMVAAATNKSVMCGFSTADNDQSYSSINYGAYFAADGHVYVYENGTLKYSGGTYAVGDTLRVAREGGVLQYRLNGALIYTSTVANTGALIVDAALYEAGATLKGARFFVAGAAGMGWQAKPDGTIELAEAAIVGGQTLAAGQVRAANAFNPALQYRGNDYGVPYPHKVQAVNLGAWKYGAVGDAEISAQLSVTLPARGSDPYANFDSVLRARVRVLNKFGDVVKAFAPVPCPPGGGIFPLLWHPAKYAHPLDEAIYEISFENAYGWSPPVYWQANTLALKQPAAGPRINCPLELSGSDECSVNLALGARLGWLLPTTSGGSGNLNLYYREVGQSSWTFLANYSATDRVADGVGANGTGSTPTFYPSRSYELKLWNSNVTAAESNILRLRIAPSVRKVTTPAVENLAGYATSSTSITLRWDIVDTSATAFFVYRDGGCLNPGAGLASGTTSYTDNTVSASTTYTYTVVAFYTNPGAWANPAVVTTPGSLNPTDPTNLTGATVSASRIDLTWLLNGNTGAVVLEWKQDDGNYASGWTTISLVAGATSYSWLLGAAGVRYAFRVKAGTSNYTNILLKETTPAIPLDR